MKTFLKVFAVLIILLIVFVIAAPFIFKGKIKEIALKEINKSINAKVNFDDVDVSLFKSFPDFQFSIKNMSVLGKDTFENYPLAKIESIKLDLDFMSVIKGEHYVVNEISINKPNLNVWVLENGLANYDITISDTLKQTEASTNESATTFELAVNNYSINEANISYKDESANIETKISGLNHSGVANLNQSVYDLKTKTACDSLTVIYEGIGYFEKAYLSADCNLEMNLDSNSYTFRENVFKVNELPLKFEGKVVLPNDEDINMNLNFATINANFKNLLSVIPSIYANDFASIQTKGKFSFDGNLNGTYNEKSLPGFNMNLTVEDGYFKYPDLPSDANDIFIDLTVSNPDGIDDNTVINLKKAHMVLADNPIDAKLLTKKPISNPEIIAELKAQLDLSTIKDLMPLESNESYSGNITADLAFEGRMSDIENENYEKFKAEGSLIILNLLYKNESLPETKIKTLYSNFSPQNIELTKLLMISGKSDFEADGFLYNYLAYYLKDEPIEGALNLKSDYINVNEWMTSESTPPSTNNSEQSNASTEQTEILLIPDNINFTLTSYLGKVLYENKEVTDIQGVIRIHDAQIDFQNIQASMLEGKFNLDGYYNTQTKTKPKFDIGIQAKKLNLPKTFQAFSTIKKLAPILEKSSGYFSTTLNMSGTLDDKMEPVMNTLNGKGITKTHNVVVENEGVLGKLAEQFQMDQFKKVNLNNVNVSFAITDGRIDIEPFDFKITDALANVNGYVTVDQQLNLKMNVNVPSSSLGKQQQQLMNLMGGLTGLQSEKVNVGVLITGPINAPKVKLDFDNLLNDAKSGIKDKVEDFKNETINKAKDEINKKKQEAIAKAQALADKTIKEAEQAAAKIKSAAKSLAQKTRNEGENAAKKVLAEAKNPIAKIAAEKVATKIRNEANAKANKIESEANTKADDLVNTARTKANSQLEAARNKTY